MASFDDVETFISRHASSGIRPGLERIRRLLLLAGNPQGAFPAVHVVGTNGKGSTCAFIASVFRAAGYKTALYTSPHLESPGERLLINGSPLIAERWMAAAEKTVETLRNDDVLRSDPPSYFELVTAAAFILTAEEGAEAAVVEAGLGGRLDATNLLSDVACSVICSISTDHTEYLGETLEKIAGEKFAVVRAGTPACYLGDAPGLIPLFKEFCASAGAEAFTVAEDVRVDNVEVTDKGCLFDFSCPGLEFKGMRTALIGRYQVANASLALLALSRLTGRFDRLGNPSVRAGMADARWPGRLEVISADPLIILDGGHNPDGVEKLTESVSALWPGKKTGVVYGVMKDKDYPACLRILNDGLTWKEEGKDGAKPSFYATCVPETERALTTASLLEQARLLAWGNEPEGFATPLEAIWRAARENELVLVCGSLAMIGWVRGRLLTSLASLPGRKG